jgi:hypothetical protein
MDVTQPIRRSFADEHVIGIDPPLRPDQPNVWRRRINAFAGRALSDTAMSAEQALRSGMQRLYGLALTPGTVEQLVVTAEPGAIGAGPADARIQLSPGLGIARSGEDISIGRTVRLPLGAADCGGQALVPPRPRSAGADGPVPPRVGPDVFDPRRVLPGGGAA